MCWGHMQSFFESCSPTACEIKDELTRSRFALCSGRLIAGAVGWLSCSLSIREPLHQTTRHVERAEVSFNSNEGRCREAGLGREMGVLVHEEWIAVLSLYSFCACSIVSSTLAEPSFRTSVANSLALASLA